MFGFFQRSFGAGIVNATLDMIRFDTKGFVSRGEP